MNVSNPPTLSNHVVSSESPARQQSFDTPAPLIDLEKQDSDTEDPIRVSCVNPWEESVYTSMMLIDWQKCEPDFLFAELAGQ